MSPENTTQLLYISNELFGVSYYKIFKILYFAEQKHLLRYCDKLISDDFYALPHGPVPTKMYNEIKAVKEGKSSVLNDCIEIKNEVNVVPLLNADLTYFSASRLECLSESILENKSLGFKELEL